MIHRKSLKFTLWNATSVKNKAIELHKFLIDHTAIINEPGLQIHLNTQITIEKTDPSLLPTNQEEGYSQQYKDISIEDIPQPAVMDKIEWTGNGNRYELNLIKVVLLLRT